MTSAATATPATTVAQLSSRELQEDRNDFDFLQGRWRVHNRRLLRPLTGSTEWIEFEGTSTVRPLWDGQSNFEEWEADAPTGQISAVSLHLYDPRARQWSLHWAARADGRIGTPTVGRFVNGRGEFYDHEDYAGRAIFLRLIWEPRGATACRFEQAFSIDGGRTWETNWIMEFTRISTSGPSTATPAADASAQASAQRFSTADAGLAASDQGAHGFDFLHGQWHVHNRRLRAPFTGSTEWYEFEGSAVERPLWDGEGNLEEYDATLPDGSRLRGLALRLYQPEAKRWTIHWSNSANGTLDPAVTGAFQDGRGEFYSHEWYQGRMIFVRFHWTSFGQNAARWEQAFSADGGHTWETNWIMEFTRTLHHAEQATGFVPTAADT